MAAARIDFGQEVEWPSPEKVKDGKKIAPPPRVANKNIPKKSQKRPIAREDSEASENSPWTCMLSEKLSCAANIFQYLARLQPRDKIQKIQLTEMETN